MNQIHALFDWDGTLSFIRAGWGEVMLKQWMEFLPALPSETEQTRTDLAHNEIWALNGRPSIHQMQRLADWIQERGGSPRTPEAFQADFQARLGRMIQERTDSIRSGLHSADHFMVLGGRQFLTRLRGAGVALHIISGTPRPFVSEEVDILGLRDFFAERIHGPLSLTDTAFHKRTAIRSIIQEYRLNQITQVIAFGDGVTEIVETVAAGGRAIAVAADEEVWHSGRLDTSKEIRLMAAGAEFSVSDYTAMETWIPRLLLSN